MSDNLLVYLVDDDQAVLDSLTGLLSAAQREMRQFLSAESFLRTLDESSACCVVTDLKMTGMSGQDLLHTLKAGDYLLPIIVVTGHATVPVTVELMYSGAVTLLEKPYKPAELLKAVDQALKLYVELRAERDETVLIQKRLDSLTADEFRVAHLLVDGATNKAVSEDMEISMRTVDRRRSIVLGKMQAKSVPDLARMLTLLQERTRNQ